MTDYLFQAAVNNLDAIYKNRRKSLLVHLCVTHITYHLYFQNQEFLNRPLVVFLSLHKCFSSPVWGSSAPAAAEHLSMHLTAAEHQHSTCRSELTWSGSL